MTALPLRLIRFPDPRLAAPTAQVSVFDGSLVSLVTAMLELMHTHGGIGLAANQVGIDASLLVADVPGQTATPLILANPRLLEGTGQAKDREGCLSLPGVSSAVPRYAGVRIAGQDMQGRPVEIAATGLLAACLQHEMDHLAGHLFVDRLSPLRRDMLLRRFRKLQRTT